MCANSRRQIHQSMSALYRAEAVIFISLFEPDEKVFDCMTLLTSRDNVLFRARVLWSKVRVRYRPHDQTTDRDWYAWLRTECDDA